MANNHPDVFPEGELTHFMGIIMKGGAVVDLMTYDGADEVEDNLKESPHWETADHVCIYEMDFNGNSRVEKELK